MGSDRVWPVISVDVHHSPAVVGELVEVGGEGGEGSGGDFIDGTVCEKNGSVGVEDCGTMSLLVVMEDGPGVSRLAWFNGR